MDNLQWREGAKAAAPIVLGYFPVAMAFGVLARKAGMTPLETGLMSLLVYAGSSQFIAVEMIVEGVAWFPTVVTTFFVNLRHFLMSSTLSLYLREKSLRKAGLLSAQLTDESFAVALSDPSKIENRPTYLLGIQMTSQASWVAGSVAGAVFGGMIDQKSYGLPFALPSLFICLLVLQIKSSRHLWMMFLAGLLSLFFKSVVAGQWHIVLTALVISTTAAAMKGQRSKPNAQGSSPGGAE